MKVKTNQGYIDAILIKTNKRSIIVEVQKNGETKRIKRKMSDIKGLNNESKD